MTALTTTTPGNDWEALLPTIRHMFANGATDPEFKIFCETARLLGLNPMLRQIWCVKNANRPDLPAQIYASRDGLLAVAHRSGQFDGMESGVMKDETGEITGAFCRIWRRDMSHPFSAEILRAEYDSGRSLWKDKPATMCVKVAEAHCLRRAFDISGVYTPDEMPEPESVIREVPDTSAPAPVRVQPKAVKVQIEPVTAGNGSPVQCGRCGASIDADPTIRIVNRDDAWMCLACLSEGTQTELPAKMQPKTVETGVTPPANGIPAPEIGAEFVCEECGTQMTASEQHASTLFCNKTLCKGCLQGTNKAAVGDRL